MRCRGPVLSHLHQGAGTAAGSRTSVSAVTTRLMPSISPGIVTDAAASRLWPATGRHRAPTRSGEGPGVLRLGPPPDARLFGTLV